MTDDPDEDVLTVAYAVDGEAVLGYVKAGKASVIAEADFPQNGDVILENNILLNNVIFAQEEETKPEEPADPSEEAEADEEEAITGEEAVVEELPEEEVLPGEPVGMDFPDISGYMDATGEVWYYDPNATAETQATGNLKLSVAYVTCQDATLTQGKTSTLGLGIKGGTAPYTITVIDAYALDPNSTAFKYGNPGTFGTLKCPSTANKSTTFTYAPDKKGEYRWPGNTTRARTSYMCSSRIRFSDSCWKAAASGAKSVYL